MVKFTTMKRNILDHPIKFQIFYLNKTKSRKFTVNAVPSLKAICQQLFSQDKQKASFRRKMAVSDLKFPGTGVQVFSD